MCGGEARAPAARRRSGRRGLQAPPAAGPRARLRRRQQAARAGPSPQELPGRASGQRARRRRSPGGSGRPFLGEEQTARGPGLLLTFHGSVLSTQAARTQLGLTGVAASIQMNADAARSTEPRYLQSRSLVLPRGKGVLAETRPRPGPGALSTAGPGSHSPPGFCGAGSSWGARERTSRASAALGAGEAAPGGGRTAASRARGSAPPPALKRGPGQGAWFGQQGALRRCGREHARGVASGHAHRLRSARAQCTTSRRDCWAGRREPEPSGSGAREEHVATGESPRTAGVPFPGRRQPPVRDPQGPETLLPAHPRAAPSGRCQRPCPPGTQTPRDPLRSRTSALFRGPSQLSNTLPPGLPFKPPDPVGRCRVPLRSPRADCPRTPESPHPHRLRGLRPHPSSPPSPGGRPFPRQLLARCPGFGAVDTPVPLPCVPSGSAGPGWKPSLPLPSACSLRTLPLVPDPPATALSRRLPWLRPSRLPPSHLSCARLALGCLPTPARVDPDRGSWRSLVLGGGFPI